MARASALLIGCFVRCYSHDGGANSSPQPLPAPFLPASAPGKARHSHLKRQPRAPPPLPPPLPVPLELPDALHTAPGKHTRIRHPFSATYNYAVVELLNQTCNIARQLPCEEYDLYEFGVLTGRSMKGYVTQLGKESVHFHRYWGFDSFVGLPQEDSSIRRTDISVQQWQPGSWSAAETLHATSYATLEQTILRFINDSRVSLVRGFYNESLTATLTAERGMRPALFVEIDCDLYLSAFAALDWMLANGLIVPGTLLVYNDWKAGGGGQGEAKAHANIVAKYNLTISRIPSWIEAIWRIKSVPSKGP